MRLIITGGLGHIGTGLLHKLNDIKFLKEIVIIDNLVSKKLHVLFGLKIKTQIIF